MYDLVKLAYNYDNFRLDYYDEKTVEIAKASEDSQKKKLQDLIDVADNAKFVSIAIVAYLIKRVYFNIKDSKDPKIEKELLTGDLSLNYAEDDYFEKLNYLFGYIIDRLYMIYNANVINLKLKGFSNFFKTDKYYREVILPEFDRILNDKYDKEKILDNIKIFDDKANKKEDLI